MAVIARTARRALLRTVGAGAGAIATVVLATGTAMAQPAIRPPNCAAADLAGIASGVAAATSAYLFAHPEVNAFFTGLRGRPDGEVPAATRAYFDTNPQALADLRGIRQPLVDFRNRCGLTAPTDLPPGE